MKKLLALVLALALSMSVVACGEKAPAGTDSSAGTGSTSGSAGTSAPAATVEGLKEAIAEQPILLTSVGQSADVEMVKSMLNKAEIKYTLTGLATSADIGDAKTLVLAVGGSSKGLGAAGIDADGELKRVNELIAAADEKGLTIIALHIGGEARRGELSDKFIAPSFAKADYAIVVADGDKDGMMVKLGSEAGIPMDVVKSMADVMAPLKAAFK